MADWSPLRERLRLVDDELTIPWQELDALVGGLPRSAYEHFAYWSGERSAWSGFRVNGLSVGRSVTFTRHGFRGTTPDAPDRARTRATAPLLPDVILIGCVKSKLDHVAAARDLYTSPLFRKARSYAEQSGKRWFVLSAQHGLVHPSAHIAPYDLRLSSTPSAYRRAWGARVVSQLSAEIGSLTGQVIEVHAGAAYIQALNTALSESGVVLVDRLHGFTMGQRLGWYPRAEPDIRSNRSPLPLVDLGDLVTKLKDISLAQPPDVLDRDALGTPGLYCWFVDARGAADLQAGLRQPVREGLIYAGLAGATRERSGRESSNTLWGRINGMHLGKRHTFSTFRHSLGAVLAEQQGHSAIDEQALTAWMLEHLRVVTLPVADAATLGSVETVVLEELDPPLNLAKRPRTPLRARLSELRRQHGT